MATMESGDGRNAAEQSQDYEASSLSFIRLHFGESGDKYELTWSRLRGKSGEELKFAKYYISKEAMGAATAAARAALERFATAWVDRVTEGQVELLEKLVAAGTVLYETLMTPERPIPANKIAFRPWFEENILAIDQADTVPGYALEVVMSSSGDMDMVPPFGLIYTPRANRPQPSTIDFESHKDFWSVSLRCSCITEVQLANAFRRRIDGNHFDTVVVHERDDRSYALVEQRLQDKNQHYRMQTHRMTSAKDLEGRLAQAYKSKSVLFHFDLKTTAPGSEIALSLSEDRDRKLQASDFRAIMNDAFRNSLGIAPDVLATPYALAVIDREAIIRGDRGREWLKIFFSTPWIGLIAVEADVRSAKVDWDEGVEIRPDRFLGLLFLRAILGRSDHQLLDSIVDARRECWPFSLFYGLYCNPHQPWIEHRPSLVEDIDAIIPHLGRNHPAAAMTQTI